MGAADRGRVERADRLTRWPGVLIAAMAIVLMVLPLAKSGYIDRAIKVYLLVIWLVLAVLQRPGWARRMNRWLYVVPIWGIYLAIYGTLGGSSELFSAIGSYSLFYSCAYIYDYYADDPRALSFLCITVLVSFLAGSIMSIGVLRANPMAARLVTTGEYSDLALTGVCEFRFAYGVAFILPCLLAAVISSRKSLLYRLLGGATLFCFLYLTYLASFGIAVGITIVGLAVALVLVIRSRDLRTVALMGVFVVVMLVLSGTASNLLFAASRSIPNETIARKLNEVAALTAQTVRSDMDILSRQRLYQRSLETFLDEPVIGAGPYFDPAQARQLGISGHSEWLDLLARLGLVGASMIIISTLALARRSCKQWKGAYYGAVSNLAFALVLAYGLVNPFLGMTEIGVVIFLAWHALPYVFGVTRPDPPVRQPLPGQLV